MRIAVVALGGNAILTPKEKGTIEQQLKHIDQTASQLSPLFTNYKVVITHGNGPQVGDLLIQQKSTTLVPAMPLDVLDSMTQGQLGYLIQRSLNEKLGKKAVTIITQIAVSKKDPAFRRPTKPIGPYFRDKIEHQMIHEPEGWRKVVASPKPKRIVELEEIRMLVEKGFTVITCGGGGIPVIEEGRFLRGVEAVIDKDYATVLLAIKLKADLLVFLTDVDSVYLNYESPKKLAIRKMNVNEAKAYMHHFKEGSMKPKIEAAIEFLKHGRGKVIITKPELLARALRGKAGTTIA
jgi:carbamate kinase